MRRALLLLIALATAAVAFACTGKDPYRPGTALGTFHVDAKLVANSCGEGQAPDPWTFDVKLARDPGTLYWIQGGLPVSGKLGADAHATLANDDTATIHGADAGLPKCALTRHDALDATLAADPADATGIVGFSGTLTYTFGPTSDSDCSDQLAFAGGTFAALPCSVSYTLSATRTKRP
jgi:hypothetical protein